MKRILLGMVALAFLTSCAVTTEKYRYQVRMDRFYQLLNDNEKAAFRKGDLDTAGASLDSRYTSDSKAKAAIDKVLQFEAITTFDGPQIMHYFYYIMLRDLNRESYLEFMGYLDAAGQRAFTVSDGGVDVIVKEIGLNSELKHYMDTIRSEFRLNGFSDKEIIQFMRSATFPEASRKEVYGLLKILKAADAFIDFRAGKTDAAAVKLENGSQRFMYTGLLSRTGLSKLDTKAFLEVYYQVVIREMDPYALSRTMADI